MLLECTQLSHILLMTWVMIGLTSCVQAQGSFPSAIQVGQRVGNLRVNNNIQTHGQPVDLNTAPQGQIHPINLRTNNFRNNGALTHSASRLGSRINLIPTLHSGSSHRNLVGNVQSLQNPQIPIRNNQLHNPGALTSSHSSLGIRTNLIPTHSQLGNHVSNVQSQHNPRLSRFGSPGNFQRNAINPTLDPMIHSQRIPSTGNLQRNAIQPLVGSRASSQRHTFSSSLRTPIIQNNNIRRFQTHSQRPATSVQSINSIRLAHPASGGAGGPRGIINRFVSQADATVPHQTSLSQARRTQDLQHHQRLQNFNIPANPFKQTNSASRPLPTGSNNSGFRARLLAGPPSRSSPVPSYRLPTDTNCNTQCQNGRASRSCHCARYMCYSQGCSSNCQLIREGEFIRAQCGQPVRQSPYLVSPQNTNMPRCQQPIDPGQCSSRIYTRYGYNPNTRTCERFYYSTCGGNENRFNTRNACIAACAQ